MVRPFFTPPPREAASIEREEFYLELILQINSFINGIVWGPIMLFLLVGTGVYLTVRCGCLQARKFGFMLRSTLGSLFRKTEKTSGGQNLTPFQAVSTALAGTVGTGNIAGVTGAIFAGGPGAVFWMWVSAFFGMMTKYAEIVLAVKYRQVDGDGTHFGGPMYYIEKGTGHKWLAVLFALLGGVACFGIGNIAQSTEIAGAMQSLVGLPPLYTGILLAILTAFVVIGGVKRIGAVAGKVVPAMAVIYVLISLIVIILHIDQLPRVLAWVVAEAFTPTAAEGGFAGATVMMAIRMGMARGVFSNEAGLGTAPMAHAAATSASPLVQASIGMLDTFIDTIIVCTMTGFAILVTGQWTSGLTGAAMTSAAFETSLPGIGGIAVTICLTFFAFTTALGWCVYGERCAIYFFGDKAQIPFRIVYCIAIPVGVLTQLDVVWLLADTCNALMAIPNLIAILLLSPVLFKLVKEDESKDSIFKH